MEQAFPALPSVESRDLGQYRLHFSGSVLELNRLLGQPSRKGGGQGESRRHFHCHLSLLGDLSQSSASLSGGGLHGGLGVGLQVAQSELDTGQEVLEYRRIPKNIGVVPQRHIEHTPFPITVDPANRVLAIVTNAV